jgi:hypothetical protein
MDLVAVFVVSIIFFVICVYMARARKRNEVLWGVIGFSFWFIPVIILALLGIASE